MVEVYSRFFDGRLEQRAALKLALELLNAGRESDQKIEGLLARYISEGRVPNFPSKTTAPISRATIQRIRNADDQALAGIRPATIGVLYNFLCNCEELKTDLFDERVRIHSAHEFAPLLESLEGHVGAQDGPLNNEKLRSLEGIFYLYRKAWTSLYANTYVRCILRFDWVGDALFYTEEQRFYDSVAKHPFNEIDTGVVLPYGMNVVLLGKGNKKDMLKFFSLHDFTPFPDGHQKVRTMKGNFIAVYNKGPHPGFRAYAQRTESETPSTEFYKPDVLDPNILKHLQD